MAAATAAAKQVVIVGGGISGVATAFYLAKKGQRSLLIDPVGIAPAASGKAGGFLALDWNDGAPMGPLARKSFALHEELAAEFGASAIDYRRLTCEAVAAEGGGARGPMVQNCIHIRAGTGDRALGPLRTGCAGIAAGRPALSVAIQTQLVADTRRRHAKVARARRTLHHAVHLHHNPPPGPTAQPCSSLTFPAAGCCGGPPGNRARKP